MSSVGRVQGLIASKPSLVRFITHLGVLYNVTADVWLLLLGQDLLAKLSHGIVVRRVGECGNIFYS